MFISKACSNLHCACGKPNSTSMQMTQIKLIKYQIIIATPQLVSVTFSYVTPVSHVQKRNMTVL